MSETVKSKFTVEDIMKNDIWLKDLERGLTVAVEASGMEYSSDIRKKINQLSEGDTIAAELESRNSLRTIWAFEDIEREQVSRSRARV
ncbi:hypothetical protein [Halorussus sp. MSC15.2]|uniref:hypothetical protein n=1 Tax=Halorussus sp. MSC15.2 TaxID=2283638 RepID=UPI0013D0C7A3|nr:hypothetical protein [Halorussus sp. MSC15.2]NEU58777.1 hypothetical protein [Halorussus sp. MSC15.2]